MYFVLLLLLVLYFSDEGCNTAAETSNLLNYIYH